MSAPAAVRPRRRILRRVLLGAGIFVLALCALLGFLLGTTPGARFLVGVVLPRLPLPVQVERVEGKLVGPFVLRGITLETERIEVRVGHFRVDFAEWGLLRRRIRISKIRLDDVTAAVREGNGEAASPPASEPGGNPPELPDIVLDLGELEHIELVLADSTTVLLADARVQGTPEDYEVLLRGRISGPRIPAAAYDLRGRGSLESFTLRRGEIRGLGGVVELGGIVSWSPRLAWEATALARDLDPTTAHPGLAEWPGAIGFLLETSGSLGDEGVELGATIARLEGIVRDLPLGGSLRGGISGETARLDTLDLAWGPVRVRAEGEANGAVRASVAVEADDLAPLGMDLAGAATATATVSGTRPSVRVDLAVEGSAIRAPGVAVESVSLTGAGGPDLAAPLRVDAVLRGIARDSSRVDAARVGFAGTLADHRLALDATGMGAALSLRLAGGVVDSTWSGVLDSLRVAHDRAGEWRSLAAARLTAGAAGGAIDSLRLGSADAALTLSGAGTADGAWNAAVLLAGLDLTRFLADLPENVAAEGVLRAEAAVTGQGANAWGEATVGIERGAVTLAGPDPVRLELSEARLTAAIDEAALRASVAMSVRRDASPLAEVSIDARIPGFAGADSIPALSVEGTVSASVADLSLAERIDPRIRDVQGRIEAAFTLGGTVGAPEVPGEFRLVDGGVSVPDLGIEFSALQLTAEGDAEGGFALRGSGRAGEGTIELEGRAPAKLSGESPLLATLKTKNAKIIETSELELFLDADLSVLATGDTVAVRGTLAVPRAAVVLVEMPPSAVAPSPDVRFVGADSVASVPVAVPDVDVQVTLGDQVLFRGLNYATRLEGSLNVRMVGREPGQGSGEIRLVDGYYQAYGQDLRIEEGRVVFSGPLADPSVEVVAYRVADDGTEAGVEVAGTLEDMRVGLYTSPAREQRDAIAYIMTGRPLSAGSGQDQAKVADAAAAIGSNVLTNRMGSRLGLDEARIEGGGESMEEASLVVGKYLNPRLFVSYGMGLFDRASSFRARYLMTPRWSVEAETGDATGADVLYRIETGN